MYEDDEEVEQEWPAVQVVVPANALEYLQSIYRNPSESDGRRMRAAMAAIPLSCPSSPSPLSSTKPILRTHLTKPSPQPITTQPDRTPPHRDRAQREVVGSYLPTNSKVDQ